MVKYRTALPQLAGSTFMTDGGLETTLIFKNGIDLPHFASFVEKPVKVTTQNRSKMTMLSGSN